MYGAGLPHRFMAINKSTGEASEVLQIGWDLKGNIQFFNIHPVGCIQTSIAGDALEDYHLAQLIGWHDRAGWPVYVGDIIKLDSNRLHGEYTVRWDILGLCLHLVSSCDTTHPINLVKNGTRVGNIHARPVVSDG